MTRASLPLRNYPKKDKIGLLFFILVITALGASLRLYFILRQDFPLNDGGMFLVMTQDLIDNQFRLPKFTSYNDAQIPFAYPPLPFYIAATISATAGITLLDIIRFLPLVFSILAIPAFFLLSREILESDPQAIQATILCAILSPSYEWVIMGGGISRAPAQLFSILALYFASRLLKSDHKKSIIPTIVFLALCGTAHLEYLWITIILVAIMAIIYRGFSQAIHLLIKLALGVTVLMAPYLIIVFLNHGAQPFASAMQSGEFNWAYGLAKLLFGNLTGEVLFTPVLVLAVLAFVRCLIKKEYLLPAWTLAIVLLNPRSLERSIIIPVCLLAGLGIDEIILPAISSGIETFKGRKNSPESSDPSPSFVNLFPGYLSLLVISYLLVRAVLSGPMVTLKESLVALPIEDRIAMAWVKENTQPDSQFLVITPPAIWQRNAPAEWFPAIAERRSVTTVQGSEWLPDGQFSRQAALYDIFSQCALEGIECLQDQSRNENLQFSHIYLSGKLFDPHAGIEFPLPLETALRASPQYRLIFESGEIIVFEGSD